VMVTSSTDPWHRAADIDTDYEHASLERTLASGLGAGCYPNQFAHRAPAAEPTKRKKRVKHSH